MSEPTTTTRRGAASKKATAVATDVTTDFVPDWAVGFDNEDYPDAVMLGEGELMFFRVLESNIIPLIDKRTKELVDTEVVQVELMTGTRVTEKEIVDEEIVDTGRLIAVGETRSLWINSFLLKKIWQEWEVQDGDEGALTYKGHQPPKSGGTPYQKWIGKFNKVNPRKVSRQSAN